jgi:hypothetical protein
MDASYYRINRDLPGEEKNRDFPTLVGRVVPMSFLQSGYISDPENISVVCLCQGGEPVHHGLSGDLFGVRNSYDSKEL